MIIFQIHNRYRLEGGEDQVVQAEAAALRSAGHEVVTHSVANPSSSAESAMRMTLAPWNPISWRKVGEKVARVQPDVVHIHNTWFSLSPSVVTASHAHSAVIMTLHNYRLGCANGQLLRSNENCRLCVDGSLWNSVIHKCYRNRPASAIGSLTIAVNRRLTWPEKVDLFLAPTQFVAEQARSFEIPGERIKVKPHFTSDPGVRKLSPSETRVVLFVGRLSPEKGVHLLLANSHLFKERGLELRVIGDGPLRLEVEKQLGTSYLGPMKKEGVIAAMLAARALVVPSIWNETQGLVALEAFSTSLPVAGSSEGAIGETIRGQGAEWVFNPRGSWVPMVDHLTDDQAISAASRVARQVYLDRFDYELAVKNLEDAYEFAKSSHERCRSSKRPAELDTA